MDAVECIAEIKSIVDSCQTTNYENVLLLNKQMQEKLLAVRAQLEMALRQLDERYKTNQSLMAKLLTRTQRDGQGKRGAYLRGNTFYFKGNMFFKDSTFRCCPNNSDYEHRRKVEHEMFPMDFELSSRHIWSMVDKLGIVQGIKSQIIDYLNQTEGSATKTSNLSKKIATHEEKLRNLLEKVAKSSFEIDWHEISVCNIHHRHSPTSCKAMWEMYLHPKLKKTNWTQSENEVLVSTAKKYEFRNWPAIAKEITDRSEYQCFIQYFIRLYVLETNRWSRWNRSDNQKLLDCIKNNTVNGIINWALVQNTFPHKSANALQSLYFYSLHPKISHEPFTEEEDILLLAAVKEYGTKFRRMPRNIIPNRSLRQLRSRYNNVLQIRNKQMPWTIEHDKQLLKFVSEVGTSDWLACSKLLKVHSRTSCRTRYLTIKRHFERDPTMTLAKIPRLKKKRNLGGSSVNTENWKEKVAEMQMVNLINDVQNMEECEALDDEMKEIKKTLFMSELSTDSFEIINNEQNENKNKDKTENKNEMFSKIKKESTQSEEEFVQNKVEKSTRKVGRKSTRREEKPSKKFKQEVELPSDLNLPVKTNNKMKRGGKKK